MAPFKTCSCCRRAISREEWNRLHYVGFLGGVGADDRLELRNCACGSTLAIPLAPSPETVRPEVRMEAP